MSQVDHYLDGQSELAYILIKYDFNKQHLKITHFLNDITIGVCKCPICFCKAFSLSTAFDILRIVDWERSQVHTSKSPATAFTSYYGPPCV